MSGFKRWCVTPLWRAPAERARGERYAAPALRKLARRHSLEAAILLEREIPARKLPRRARRK